MTVENFGNKESITISTLEDLKRELGSDLNLERLREEFKKPIIVTREELDALKEELSGIEEQEGLEKVRGFIRKKVEISLDTERKLVSLDTERELSSLKENQKTADVFEQAEEAVEKTQRVKGLKSIDRVFGTFEKIRQGISNFFDKIGLAFSLFMWKYAPSIAEFLGLENPASKMKEEVKNEAQKKSQEAIEELQKKQTILNQEIEKQTTPNHLLYGKIYFKLFSSKNELQKVDWIDYDLEQDIASDLISHNKYFLNLKYNDLKNNPDIIERLYSELIKLDPKYKDKPKDTIKKHIDIIIKNIVGGDIEYTSGFLFFKKTKKESLTKGSEFIEKIYEAKGQDITSQNPSIKEIFESLNSLKDFDIFINNSVDFEEIFKSVSGKLDAFLSSGKNTIANISEQDFISLKDKLPKGILENITYFKAISVAILGSHNSRTLENNFSFAEENNEDGITKFADKDLIEGFIGNENEGLIKFGNEIYKNVFVSGKPISGLENVQKSDLTLKDVYRLYLVTGGESDVDKLNPIQKMNLTVLLLVGFSSAEGLGQKLGEISKLKNTSIKISPEVQDMLIRIGNTAVDIAKTALKATGEFAWGFIKENPALRAGIILILWKFPFLTKRQSISDIISGKG